MLYVAGELFVCSFYDLRALRSVFVFGHPGLLRSFGKYGKFFCHLRVWKSLEKTLGASVTMEKENNFPDLIF